MITEGLFGIRPVGFKAFELKPALPSDWNTMSLKQIKAFGISFDIAVTRVQGGKLEVTVSQEGSKIKKYVVKEGQTVKVTLQ